MSGMSKGFLVSRSLRASSKEVKIILLTYVLKVSSHYPNDGSTSGLTDLSSKKDPNR